MACFKAAEILLPNTSLTIDKWAVVACDQYTSEIDYWHKVEEIVDDNPSTYHLIFPEVYLDKDDDRVATINKNMDQYLKTGLLQSKIKDGYVLVERDTTSGKRLGLVGVIDLEDYDYHPKSNSLIRATEGTIEARIPPRLKVRENAKIELPHVMVLIDDNQNQLIETIYNQKEQLPLLYDSDLMLNGGHIKGYAVENEMKVKVDQLLDKLQQESNGLFLVVGDGNHSLATAKTHWNKIKDKVAVNHPARYAMVELVNLHSPALIFEPIHRVLFNVDSADLINNFINYLHENNINYQTGDDVVFMYQDNKQGFDLLNEDGVIAIDILQTYLDDYLIKNPASKIDYVHGSQALLNLSNMDGNCGIKLKSIDKNGLFKAIKAGGVLPRKTFSMGESYEKRYYIESRKINE